MTDEPLDLDAELALANAATPGPWEARTSVRGSMFPDEVVAPYSSFGRRIPAECHQPEDAAFIARARTLVPTLIDAVKTAENRALIATKEAERHENLREVAEEAFADANRRAREAEEKAARAHAVAGELERVRGELRSLRILRANELIRGLVVDLSQNPDLLVLLDYEYPEDMAELRKIVFGGDE